MKRQTQVLLVLLPVAACIGCEAPLRIQPGMSAIQINVRAKPKTGYRPSPRRSPNSTALYPMQDDSPIDPSSTGPFERVNYRTLEDIVVWIEPESSDVALPSRQDEGTVRIDVKPSRGRGTRPVRPPLNVIGVGGRLRFRNLGPQADAVFSFSKSNTFDLGDIPPNGESTYVVQAPGLIEVLCASREEPLVRVYAAPSRWVKRITSKTKATFTDLPPGRYRVSCWHPRLPGSRTVVILKPDELTRETLTVSVNNLTEIP
ncbi:MAG: hypothetical protein IID39_01460 [Planctomycetes bacterium]|nr:hypothetical protein [Planctomycetota bacterium]